MLTALFSPTLFLCFQFCSFFFSFEMYFIAVLHLSSCLKILMIFYHRVLPGFSCRKITFFFSVFLFCFCQFISQSLCYPLIWMYFQVILDFSYFQQQPSTFVDYMHQCIQFYFIYYMTKFPRKKEYRKSESTQTRTWRSFEIQTLAKNEVALPLQDVH